MQEIIKVINFFLIKRKINIITWFNRLLTTYRALERLSQSEFNLDRLEAAASAAQITPGATLVVPGAPVAQVGRKSKDHALTVKDVERERGKQLSKYERNMMIFNWLHTLDDTVEESLQ